MHRIESIQRKPAAICPDFLYTADYKEFVDVFSLWHAD